MSSSLHTDRRGFMSTPPARTTVAIDGILRGSTTSSRSTGRSTKRIRISTRADLCHSFDALFFCFLDFFDFFDFF